MAGLWSDLPVAAQQVEVCMPNAEKLGWYIGVQLYTYQTLPLYDALDRIAALGVRHIQPCLFLRLDKERPSLQTNEELSAEVRKELKDQLAECGGMSCRHSTPTSTPTQIRRRRFSNSGKEMRVGTIVAHNPPVEAFDVIEKLCEEYQVNVAIHNHPWAEKED